MRSFAKTPCPGIKVPENDPSYTEPTPHEGLLDCNITSSAPASITCFNASSAPRLNSIPPP